jgi:hypothetical protein
MWQCDGNSARPAATAEENYSVLPYKEASAS